MFDQGVQQKLVSFQDVAVIGTTARMHRVVSLGEASRHKFHMMERAVQPEKMDYAKSYFLFALRNLNSLVIISLALIPHTGCGNSGSKANQRHTDIQGNSLSVEQTAPVNQTKLSEVAQTVHRDVNGYRVSHGLQPLALNPIASQVATGHSREMATGKVPFGHDGFEERVKTLRQSLSFDKAAENVGYNMGYADPASKAVQSWLHSPEHLENIEGDFNLTGIGVAKNDKGEYYFTQIFLKQGK